MKKITLITFVLSIVSVLHLKAQVGTTYDEGQVTELTYLKVEYGHFDDYVKWLNSTWKPYMQSLKKAELIVDYKVFSMRPKSLDEPNVMFMIIYKNMAELDRTAEREALAMKMIGSVKEQDEARAKRNEYRKRLGTELIRELILK